MPAAEAGRASHGGHRHPHRKEDSVYLEVYRVSKLADLKGVVLLPDSSASSRQAQHVCCAGAVRWRQALMSWREAQTGGLSSQISGPGAVAVDIGKDLA